MKRWLVVSVALALPLASPSTTLSQYDTLSAVSPSVVVVFQAEGKKVSLGTGFIAANGYVITAAHVILQSRLPVFLGRQGRITPERVRLARVVRINRDADVAILDAGYEPVGLRFQNFPAQVGDEVWVFGYEFLGKDMAILRMARASIGQRWRDFFQVDGAVQPGFSGGPVTTRGGRVVGLLSFGSRLNPNLAYLVPAHVLQEELDALPSRSPLAAPPSPQPTPQPVPIYTPPPPSVVAPSVGSILPGVRIGPIALGMSLAQATAAMGRPHDQTGRSVQGRSTYYSWFLDSRYYQGIAGKRPEITVWIDDGWSIIDQIDVTATRFLTPGGNGVGSPADGFVREFGPPTSDRLWAPGERLWRFGSARISIVARERDMIVHTVIVWAPTTGLQPAPLSGNWSGVWASRIGSQGGPFIAAFVQSGTSVSGTASLAGSPCFGGFQVSGTSEASSFVLDLISGGVVRARLMGIVTGSSMQGGYTVLTTGTRCDGDQGTFAASRQ